MPDTATAAPEAAPDAPVLPSDQSTFDSMASNFDAALKKQQASDEPATLTNEVHETPPAKPAVVEKPAAESTDAIPEQLITEKPEEAKTETAPDAELPKGASPKSHEAFALVKTQREAFRAERDKLAAEVETLRKAPKEDNTLKTEVETLRKRLAESDALIERIGFEHSPTMKEFAAKEAGLMKLAEGEIEGTDIKPDVLRAAVNARGPQRREILRNAGMDSETIAAVVAHLVGIDVVQQNKAEALAKQGELAAQWDAEQKTQAQHREAQQAAEDERVFTEVGARIETKMAPFQKVEGNEKWNAQVDRLKAEAKEFYSGKMPLEKLAEIAYAGIAYKVEAQRSAVLAQRLAAANAELAKLKAAQPDTGMTNGVQPKPNTGLSLDEQRAAAFDAALGR